MVWSKSAGAFSDVARLACSSKRLPVAVAVVMVDDASYFLCRLTAIFLATYRDKDDAWNYVASGSECSVCKLFLVFLYCKFYINS